VPRPQKKMANYMQNGLFAYLKLSLVHIFVIILYIFVNEHRLGEAIASVWIRRMVDRIIPCFVAVTAYFFVLM